MLLLLFALTAQISPEASGLEFKQPQLAVSGSLAAVTVGSGNAVYFAASRDGGRTFGKPVKVAAYPKLALGRHRGPRIAIAPKSIVISAIAGELGGGKDGDLIAWRSSDGGETWSKGVRVNDVAASAREGLHAMAAGGNGLVYASWLDLREKGTKLYGAWSLDGGATWSRNVLIYESPEGTICQCCHPSLAIDARGWVHAMWRNALAGNRDMYLARSTDGGKTWGEAEKLGNGSWVLNACPMDGGGLALDDRGNVVSVWRREGAIFQGPPGVAEAPVGPGKDPAVAAAKRGVYLAWSGAEGVRARTPAGSQILTLDPKGAYVQLAPLAHGAALAAWESGGAIRLQILN
jgi:hypothetical protein